MVGIAGEGRRCGRKERAAVEESLLLLLSPFTFSLVSSLLSYARSLHMKRERTTRKQTKASYHTHPSACCTPTPLPLSLLSLSLPPPLLPVSSPYPPPVSSIMNERTPPQGMRRPSDHRPRGQERKLHLPHSLSTLHSRISLVLSLWMDGWIDI